jgi:hypothetical protein
MPSQVNARRRLGWRCFQGREGFATGHSAGFLSFFLFLFLSTTGHDVKGANGGV